SASGDRSLFFQAEIVSSVAEHAGMPRFDLCGMSYGGLVAFTLASRYPERVRRLVMVDSPGPVYTEADNQQILSRYRVNSVADVVIPKDPAGVRTLLELAWERPPPTPEFILRETWERVFTDQVVEKRGLLDWLDVRRRQPGINPDLSLEQRTLLVWGANDPLFPLGVGERLNAALPNASLFVIDKARHAPNLEHPGRFNRAVSDFLRS
ncbi:MAG: alpha/beta fold hydrolase, partial [Rhodobacterales bacterium]|nr:alpha/beta fold hydrolase [Rhodobacterales bacterium]